MKWQLVELYSKRMDYFIIKDYYWELFRLDYNPETKMFDKILVAEYTSLVDAKKSVKRSWQPTCYHSNRYAIVKDGFQNKMYGVKAKWLFEFKDKLIASYKTKKAAIEAAQTFKTNFCLNNPNSCRIHKSD